MIDDEVGEHMRMACGGLNEAAGPFVSEPTRVLVQVLTKHQDTLRQSSPASVHKTLSVLSVQDTLRQSSPTSVPLSTLINWTS